MDSGIAVSGEGDTSTIKIWNDWDNPEGKTLIVHNLTLRPGID